MTTKTTLHLPHFNRDDLKNKKNMARRRWRMSGAYECGRDISAGTKRAETRRFTSCKKCQQRYDAWWRSIFKGNDLHAMAQHAHLVGTNMDPNACATEGS